MNNKIKQIFKNGSTTYFYSSIFFPPEVKEDVFTLYSFVRKADDFVDTIPQRTDDFYNFREMYNRATKGEVTNNIVIDSFAELTERKGFQEGWVRSFFDSMEADLSINNYYNIEDLKKYLFGSAEVVGLMMAKILELPEESYKYAMLLGRAMQYVNFIRDISEDIKLGRNYFPYEEMEHYNLENLRYKHISKRRDNFKRFINKQISRYLEWQNIGEKGYSYIPRRYLIPIKTASEMYKWTANVIRTDPLIVYKNKVKPSILRIIYSIGHNSLFGGRSFNV